MPSQQWSTEVGKNRITEYRSFGIIYRTEPNNTEPNLTVYKSSNIEIKTQFLSLLKTLNLILHHWGEFWKVHTPFLLCKETSLVILKILKKIICLKNFSELFYLWFYPVDIRFGFSWKCRTEPNRIPNNTESCFGSVYHWSQSTFQLAISQNLWLYSVVCKMTFIKAK